VNYGGKPTAGEWRRLSPTAYRHVTGRRVESSGRTDSLKWIVVGGRYDGYLFGKREHAMLGAEDTPYVQAARERRVR
jgi:hypothetical protein